MSAQSAGGNARAAALSPAQRKEIAKKAAAARWDNVQSYNPPDAATRKAMNVAFDLAADIALAVDSGRGNEKFIARTIRALKKRNRP